MCVIQFWKSETELTFRCGLCSLSGEELNEDESIRLQIRDLSEEIESLESDPLEALKKAEMKLELMENIRDRVILRFPHQLLTSVKCISLISVFEEYAPGIAKKRGRI